ncbi:Zn-dependent hydrolase [Terrihabitans rhizophilus]|uniref:Zn-dependent hydrolase n=1 Tax=Terrihabitans rhizophilus TaxID=3092662 RepID=A0ABU4RKS8_9HYPH|nr:Zn-dependent hydrolase [Terrihabitans sp. PJ23]MDX6805448.1 Zn-dependent hydrolase [Terrihabitans sp. PJ23]
MAEGDNRRVDGARLWQSLMDMARIGPGVRGGNNRQALTDEDREGRLLFAEWCRNAGLAMTVDTMGNMFARREGTKPGLPPVVVGSHLDTQPTGGKFDGVLGVLGGLEVVRTMNDLGIRTRHPVEVVNWTNEEGSRFAPAMVASGVFAGVLNAQWAKSRTDADGRSLGAELARIGFEGEEVCGRHPVHAYFELHIEQGPILEDQGVDIGVVTHGQGLRWVQVTLTGRDAHTGSTPMRKRVDAGLGAARIVDRVNDIAWRYPPHAVGAVGMLNHHPNSRNIIAGKAVFTVDFRHPDRAVIEAMVAALEIEGRKIAADLGLEIAFENVGAFDPVTFDEGCVDTVREAARTLNLSYRDIVSGAGHDACWVAGVAPTAMIMCPCVDGLSHNEDETITPQWAAAGTNVLLHAVLRTAGVES